MVRHNMAICHVDVDLWIIDVAFIGQRPALDDDQTYFRCPSICIPSVHPQDIHGSAEEHFQIQFYAIADME